MQFFNVHRTNADKLERLLNEHAERGWSLHHIRGVGNPGAAHLAVLFVREFADVAERDRYLAERQARKAARQQPVADAVPA
jgi:hypothetical protein